MFSMKSPLINKSLRDYCRKSTENSIRKLTEKYNLERNTTKLADEDENTQFNIYGFIAFLSMTTFAFVIYKKLQ